MTFHALIAAGGAGVCFDAGIPKQYSLVHGKPVLRHAVERLASGFALTMTYVVVADNDRWIDAAIGELPDVAVLRCGGSTRGASIRNALALMPGLQSDDWIVVHDGVRPCIDRASLLRLQSELGDDSVGGLLAVPVSSTLKSADAATRVAGTQPRVGLWTAQTPQMFRYGVLREAYSREGAEHASDEAHAVEATGAKPGLVMGSRTNIAIACPADLLLAAQILSAGDTGS